MAGTRDKYKAYIAQLLQLAGYADPQGAAGRIMDLETKIAKAHETREQSEDFANGTQVWTRAAARAEGAGHRLGRAARRGPARQCPEVRRLSFRGDPEAVGAGRSEPLQNWKDWLAFHTINSQANVLPKPFREASFAFNGTVLQGVPKQRPREMLGAERDQQRAPGRGRQGLCRQIFPGFGQGRNPGDGRQYQERLRAPRPGDRLDGAVDQAGSDEEGRGDRRRRRLSRHLAGLFRPARSRPTTPMPTKRTPALFEYKHQIAKIGKPMDRKEWWMPPQLVNAVNLPVQNALNFPAAILVKPFFDPGADPAFNYGAIGSCDRARDQPQLRQWRRAVRRQRRLRNWWTPADFKRFTAAGDALAAQFDQYEALPGPSRQRQADARREYRRRRRPRRRLRGVQGVAERQAGADDPGPDRRPALLPRLRAGMGGKMDREPLRSRSS